MKLISHGLQGGEPFAKVELSLHDLERLRDFIFFSNKGYWVGDLRRQMEEMIAKLQFVSLPPEQPAAWPDVVPAALSEPVEYPEEQPKRQQRGRNQNPNRRRSRRA